MEPAKCFPLTPLRIMLRRKGKPKPEANHHAKKI